MKALNDPDRVLANGLAAIRAEFQVPQGFPPAVLAAAEAAAARVPSDHRDRTDWAFVTLDPARSTDLDQAFAIEATGDGWLLHYAIADVAWFVSDGDPVDTEAWKRGETLYLPDGKAGLYPPVLSENAASLLPDGPRPAMVFTTRVASDGEVTLAHVERALVRSRAKLGYEIVADADLPDGFVAMTDALAAAERRRGGARVDPPEQEVAPAADGRLALAFRPRAPAEDRNAALSLATNIAVARVLQAQGTGLFRVMAEPDAAAIRRLRHTAAAFHIDWAPDQPLDAFERTLDARDPRAAALMLAIRRAGHGASYAPFDPGRPAWHAAVAAPYAHVTAPLRRLADRYVIQAALAVANGGAVPAACVAAFPRLPPVMARADALAGRIDRAVIDLAEAAILSGREGERFAAIVTDSDDRGAQIQLCAWPVVARLATPGLTPGQAIDVTLTTADPASRHITFASALD